MASVILADDSRKSRNIISGIIREYNRTIKVDEVGNGLISVIGK